MSGFVFCQCSFSARAHWSWLSRCQAEQNKIKKYSYLTSQAYHSFTPVAFETSGICGPCSMSFLTDLDRHIANTTDDKALWPFGGGMQHPFWELCLQPSPLLSMMFSGSML
ncbi:hypothetical protein EMCRGX_G028901 [Ephydatia muelleri]